ncbi:unnamed protein product [Mycena citricolor]|uniref:Uncharacterized protein n=1 Tax=Mycena citricolor TaxID=2018698 RepID=A0AAD2HKT5_9AGAR|nr:unnamed protein product [Mycena citricolor]
MWTRSASYIECRPSRAHASYTTRAVTGHERRRSPEKEAEGPARPANRSGASKVSRRKCLTPGSALAGARRVRDFGRVSAHERSCLVLRMETRAQAGRNAPGRTNTRDSRGKTRPCASGWEGAMPARIRQCMHLCEERWGRRYR